MSSYTRVGTGLWDWEPFTELDMPARNLCLAIYTSAESKRLPTGLWHGGIATLAEASRMSGDMCVNALDDMIKSGLMEYDQQRRVVRMTELPDDGERPTNGKMILGWWTKFKTVPACPIRDAHVATLRWLVDQGSVTKDHEQAWALTFATIKIPVSRPRGRRGLVQEGDQVHPSQGSLFSGPTPNPIANPIDRDPGGSGERSIRGGVSDPETETNQGVSIPYRKEPVSGSRNGTRSGLGLGDPDGTSADPERRPALTLVPMPESTLGPFTADDLADVFGQRRTQWPPGMRERVSAAILDPWVLSEATPVDLALLREAIESGVMPEVVMPISQDATDGVASAVTTRRYVGWERVFAFEDPARLLDTIHRARERSIRIAEQRKHLAELRERSGI